MQLPESSLRVSEFSALLFSGVWRKVGETILPGLRPPPTPPAARGGAGCPNPPRIFTGVNRGVGPFKKRGLKGVGFRGYSFRCLFVVF